MDDTQATTGTATAAPAATTPQDQPVPAAPTPADGGRPDAEATPAGDAPAAPIPDWRQHIDAADPKDLKQHPRIQGIVGEMVDKAVRRWVQQQDEAVSQRAAHAAESQLLEMARRDPEAFAERFLSDKQKDSAIRQLESVRGDIRAEFARYVGRAFQDVPEWSEFTSDHHARLAQAVAGKPDDEVVAAYNRAAVEIVAEIRADKRAGERVESFKKTELAKEREAIRKEIAAELLKAEQKPDLSRGGRPAAFDPTTLTDTEYDRWYETEGPGRQLGLARR